MPASSLRSATLDLPLALVLALVGASAGCATAPSSQAAQAEQRAKADEAAKAAQASLEEAPLSALRMRAAGERLLEAGKAGRAHALLLAAQAVLADPPPAEAAGAAISGSAGGGSLAPSAPPAPPDPAGPGGPEALAKLVQDASAVQTLPGASASAHGPARERTSKARDDALRFYREKQYAKALERFEKLTRDDEPRLARYVASCRLNLAFAATEEGRDADAVDHLWGAADADPARRTATLYGDVARLERRIAVTRQGAGDMPGCDAALRRAFRAAPDDGSTLYLLTRRKDLPVAERDWYARRLGRLHPDQTQAEFLSCAEEVRAAKDTQAATEIVDRFAAKFPAQAAMTADLRSLVAERAKGDAAKDAASARKRYEEAAKAARESRTAFESGIQESSEPAPEGPAGPVAPTSSATPTPGG